jgi:hypothetical protein
MMRRHARQLHQDQQRRLIYRLNGAWTARTIARMAGRGAVRPDNNAVAVLILVLLDLRGALRQAVRECQRGPPDPNDERRLVATRDAVKISSKTLTRAWLYPKSSDAATGLWPGTPLCTRRAGAFCVRLPQPNPTRKEKTMHADLSAPVRAPADSDGFSLRLVDWQPRQVGALLGRATVELNGLIIDSIGIFERDGARWSQLPSEPVRGSDGAILKDDRGKARYRSALKWRSRDLQDRFSAAVIEAIERRHGPIGNQS